MRAGSDQPLQQIERPVELNQQTCASAATSACSVEVGQVRQRPSNGGSSFEEETQDEPARMTTQLPSAVTRGRLYKVQRVSQSEQEPERVLKVCHALPLAHMLGGRFKGHTGSR